MNPIATEFRPVPGFEGLYSVSADGRVLSLGRTVQSKVRGGVMATRYYRGRILRPRHKGDGSALRVNLWAKGAMYSPYVSALVRDAWGEEAARAFRVRTHPVRNRVAQLERVFAHRHSDRRDGTDICSRCGLDLRDTIHLRAGDTRKETFR